MSSQVLSRPPSFSTTRQAHPLLLPSFAVSPLLQSEFASQYLPSFIKACRSHRKDSPPETFNIFLSLACRLVRTPSFGRYIREHPDAGSLFPFLVTVLAEDCPSYDDLNHGVSLNVSFLPCPSKRAREWLSSPPFSFFSHQPRRQA